MSRTASRSKLTSPRIAKRPNRGDVQHRPPGALVIPATATEYDRPGDLEQLMEERRQDLVRLIALFDSPADGAHR